MAFEATNCIIVVFDNQKYFNYEEYFNCDNRAQQRSSCFLLQGFSYKRCRLTIIFVHIMVIDSYEAFHVFHATLIVENVFNWQQQNW